MLRQAADMDELVLMPVGRTMADDQAYLQALLAKALQETARNLLRQTRAQSVRPATQRASHRGPSNPLHRTWRGFVEDLQLQEGLARREHLKLTMPNVCRFGVDTPKTIARTMRWYGLDGRRDWPPSKWDSKEPREGGQNW